MEVSAILLNEGRLANEIRHLGIPVDVVDEANGSFFQLIKNTGNIIDRKSPHIIHSHRYKENIVAFLSSKSKNDIRLVSTQHGMPEYIGTNRILRSIFFCKNLIFHFFQDRFVKSIAVSKDMQKIFINKYGFQENKVAMIHNGTEIHMNSQLKRDKDYLLSVPWEDFPCKRLFFDGGNCQGGKQGDR